MTIQSTFEAEAQLLEKLRTTSVQWSSKHPSYSKKFLEKYLYIDGPFELAAPFQDIGGIDAAMQGVRELTADLKGEHALKKVKNHCLRRSTGLNDPLGSSA